MNKRRRFLLSLFAFLLLVGIPTGIMLRVYRQDRADRELIFALKASQTNKALAMLEAGADPNFRDPGQDVLSLQRYLSTLWLHMRGIKSPAPKMGSTALELAVVRGNAVLAEALLGKGARNVGETALTSYRGTQVEVRIPLLSVAATNKDFAIVQALVKHGWNVNAVDLRHETALFYAGDATTTRDLVALGASIDANNDSGWTPLDSAIYSGRIDVANALMELGAKDARAILSVVRNHDTSMVQRMLDLGWQVDTVDEEDGSTLLMVATQSASSRQTIFSPDMALLLLQRGANVNFRDREGNTPLLLAAGVSYFGRTDESLLVNLLERGARIDEPDENGLTPLMVAASHLRPSLVRLLLQHGAHVNMRTREGDTALSLTRRSPYIKQDEDNHDRTEVNRLLRIAGETE